MRFVKKQGAVLLLSCALVCMLGLTACKDQATSSEDATQEALEQGGDFAEVATLDEGSGNAD